MPNVPSRPFGLPETPYNPATGRYLALDRFANVKVKLFYVISEEDNYLVCKKTTDVSETPPREFHVAKPYTFRRTSYDELTINDVDYEYVSSSRRTATWRDVETGYFAIEHQCITEDYIADEEILAIHVRTGIDDVDEKRIVWLDLNIGGKTWAVHSWGT